MFVPIVNRFNPLQRALAEQGSPISNFGFEPVQDGINSRNSTELGSQSAAGARPCGPRHAAGPTHARVPSARLSEHIVQIPATGLDAPKRTAGNTPRTPWPGAPPTPPATGPAPVSPAHPAGRPWAHPTPQDRRAASAGSPRASRPGRPVRPRAPRPRPLHPLMPASPPAPSRGPPGTLRQPRRGSQPGLHASPDRACAPRGTPRLALDTPARRG